MFLQNVEKGDKYSLYTNGNKVKFMKPKQSVKGSTDLDEFDFDEYDEDEPEEETDSADTEPEDEEE